MSSFTRAEFERVEGKERGGRPVYRAKTAFSFYIGNPETGCTIGVPAGFETDFASIPAWIGRLLPRWIAKALSKSAALHDRMREDMQFNLIDCDALMLVAMRADKVPSWLRWATFFAVRTNKSRVQHNA